jgi:hypothetical protein
LLLAARGDRLGLYRVEAAMDQALAMTQVLVGAADQVASGLHGLREGDDIAPPLAEIRRLEMSADRIVRETVANVLEGVTLKRANGRH